MTREIAKGVILREGAKLDEFNHTELQWQPIGIPAPDHYAVLRKRRLERGVKRAEREMKIREITSFIVMGVCGVILLWAATL